MPKISQYPDGSPGLSTDEVVIRRGASDYRLPLSQVSGGDGWTPVTWANLTRTGAQTFTTTTDVTGIVQRGDRLKFTDTTTKYLPIKSVSAYSGGLTTITLFTSTDYTLVGNPSNMYYSKLANPQGWPEWFNYTPTWGGFSVNPTSVTAKFAVIGKIIWFILGSLGSGTSNSTDFTITLTAAPVSTLYVPCPVIDAGADQPVGFMALTAGLSTLTVYKSAFNVFTASNGKRMNPVVFAFEYS